MSQPVSYLVERALHTVAGVGCGVLERPAQGAQAVVRSVAHPVHQVGGGLLSYRQIKAAHRHRCYWELQTFPRLEFRTDTRSEDQVRVRSEPGCQEEP